jgi:hypothetical protein
MFFSWLRVKGTLLSVGLVNTINGNENRHLLLSTMKKLSFSRGNKYRNQEQDRKLMLYSISTNTYNRVIHVSVKQGNYEVSKLLEKNCFYSFRRLLYIRKQDTCNSNINAHSLLVITVLVQQRHITKSWFEWLIQWTVRILSKLSARAVMSCTLFYYLSILIASVWVLSTFHSHTVTCLKFATFFRAKN